MLEIVDFPETTGSDEKGRKGNILVINKARNGKCLARWLERTGYNCTFVDSDEQADALTRSSRFDAIVYSQESSILKVPLLADSPSV